MLIVAFNSIDATVYTNDVTASNLDKSLIIIITNIFFNFKELSFRNMSKNL
jgi:hypothetical protein